MRESSDRDTSGHGDGIRERGAKPSEHPADTATRRNHQRKKDDAGDNRCGHSDETWFAI
jgi:hypothetical protein